MTKQRGVSHQLSSSWGPARCRSLVVLIPRSIDTDEQHWLWWLHAAALMCCGLIATANFEEQ